MPRLFGRRSPSDSAGSSEVSATGASSDLAVSGLSSAASTASRVLFPRVLDVRPVEPLRPVLRLLVREPLLLGDQLLPIGHRDLEVVRMDFREGEEAVAVAAVFDEGGLQRGLDADDLGEVDVALERLARGRLEVEFGELGSVDDDHPGLFGMGGIDQHAAGHWRAPRDVGDPIRREQPAALPPLWREGDGAFRPAERPTQSGQDGEASHRRTTDAVLPTSRFLISRHPERGLRKGRYDGDDCSQDSTYGVRTNPTNKK